MAKKTKKPTKKPTKKAASKKTEKPTKKPAPVKLAPVVAKPATVKRKPTIAAGAVMERDYVREWARRRVETLNSEHQELTPFQRGYETACNDLLQWLEAQPRRVDRRGGTGRR